MKIGLRAGRHNCAPAGPEARHYYSWRPHLGLPAGRALLQADRPPHTHKSGRAGGHRPGRGGGHLGAALGPQAGALRSKGHFAQRDCGRGQCAIPQQGNMAAIELQRQVAGLAPAVLRARGDPPFTPSNFASANLLEASCNPGLRTQAPARPWRAALPPGARSHKCAAIYLWAALPPGAAQEP